MTGVDVVLQGGGSNCVGLAAAAYELRQRRVIRRVAGTSAGGLVALALAFDVDPERLQAVLAHALAENRLIDGDLGCFLSRYGWCRGDALRTTARNLVGEGARLGDARRPVAVVVGDLYARAPRVLSSWATPNVLVEDAATATAAIPGVFAAQEIRGLGVGNRLHVDGGVSMNFGLDLFDDQPDTPTVGIRPAQRRDGLRPVRDLKAYLWALAGLRQWAADNAYRSGKAAVSIVDVPGGDGLDFSLSAVDIQQRWDAGIEAMRRAQLEG
jgi:NTE family protein